MSQMGDRLVSLGRELARQWLHTTVWRTVWSLPLPVVLLIAALLALWIVWVGP